MKKSKKRGEKSESPDQPDNLLQAIQHVTDRLVSKFTFGYFTKEDIRQEIALFCLEALPRYDHSRPLPNFLYVHCLNRLKNLRRNHFQRNDPPCIACRDGLPCRDAEQSQDKNMVGGQSVCEKYADWHTQNVRKTALSQAGGKSDTAANQRASRERPVEEIESQDLLAKIDQELPMEMRADYLRILEGAPVSKASQEAITEAIRKIIE